MSFRGSSPQFLPFGEWGSRMEDGTFVRVAVVRDVDAKEGTCTIDFLDSLSSRPNVVIPCPFAAPDMGIFIMPTPGTRVLGLFRPGGEFTIIGTVAHDYSYYLDAFKHRPMQSGEMWIKSAGGAEIDLAIDGSIAVRDSMGEEVTLDPNAKKVTVKASDNLEATIGSTSIKVGKRLPDATIMDPLQLAAMLVPSIGVDEYVEIETGRKIQDLTGTSVSPVVIKAGNLNETPDPTGMAYPPEVSISVKSQANPTQSANVLIKSSPLGGSPEIVLNDSDIPGDLTGFAKKVARKGDMVRLSYPDFVTKPDLVPSIGPDVLTWMIAMHAALMALMAAVVTGASPTNLPGMSAAAGTALSAFTAATKGGVPPTELRAVIHEGSKWVKAGGAPDSALDVPDVTV